MIGMRCRLLASVCMLFIAQGWAAEPRTVNGILLEVHPAEHSIVVSCEAIPGYMEAMVMPFAVRGSDNLNALVPGTMVQFEIVEEQHQDYAQHLHVVQVSNYEAEPTEARRLTFLHRALD